MRKSLFLFFLVGFFVFSGMTYGEEAESESPVVTVEYDGTVDEGELQTGTDEKDYPKPDYDINSGKGAINVVTKGGNLGTVSTAALKAGVTECGDNESMADIKAMLTAEIALREKYGENYIAAVRAEKHAASYLKKYVIEMAKLDNLKQQLIEAEKGLKSNGRFTFFVDAVESAKKYQAIANELAAQEKAVVNAQKASEVASAAMRDAYGRLAEAYNMAGDPVRIGTGEFQANYVDFEAMDYRSFFKVKRNLSYTDCVESFGKNWSCSLDSRIIKCVGYDYSKMFQIMEKIVSQQKRMESILLSYKNAYYSYEDDEVEEYFKEIKKDLSCYTEGKSALRDHIRKNYVDYEGVNYVDYGVFSIPGYHLGNEKMICHLDDEGVARLFILNSDGYWEGFDIFTKATMKIYALDKEGEISTSGESYYGYALCYKDGRIKYYSPIGKLVKERSVNGNYTEYLYSDSFGRPDGIRLCTGEEIAIHRNSSNLITKLEGKISGTTSFTYNGDLLTGVTDNKGITIKYVYDEYGYLIHIVKEDDSSVNITYSYNNELMRTVCTSVTNENGEVETFQYVPASRMVIHTMSKGRKEVYKYNNSFNTVYKCNVEGEETSIKTDSEGRIKSETKNGLTKTYSYDGNNQIVRIDYSTGGYESFSYNDYGNIISHVDRDGFERKYFHYLSYGPSIICFNGDIISTFYFNGMGLVAALLEDGFTYLYDYNNLGQLIKKTTEKPDKTKFVENWTYDSNYKLIEYKNSNGRKVEYLNLSNKQVETEKESGFKTSYYDKRGRVVVTECSDAKSKKSHRKVCEYDNSGRVTKIFLDGELFAEYEYEYENQLKSYTIWKLNGEKNCKTIKQGVKTEFVYNQNGFIVKEACKVVDLMTDKNREVYLSSGQPYVMKYGEIVIRTMNYQRSSNTFKVYEYSGEKSESEPIEYVYDCENRLISRTTSDKYKKEFVYSKAGRLLQEKDNRGNQWNYSYNTDGSFVLTQSNRDRNQCFYYFNKYNQIVRFLDFEKNETVWKYDFNGRLIEISAPDYIRNITYDNNNRASMNQILDNKYRMESYITAKYNDSNNTASKSMDGIYSWNEEYDYWGRIVKATNNSGETCYEYDVLGNVIQQKNPDGEVFNFEYTVFGNIGYLESNLKPFVLLKYDAANRLVSVCDNGIDVLENSYNDIGKLSQYINLYTGKTEFNYGLTGVIEEINSSDTGSLKYQADKLHNRIDVLKNDELYWVFNIGTNGNIVSEKDCFGNEQSFIYDKNGYVNEKQDFMGMKQKLTYDRKTNSTIVDYSTGEKSYVSKNVFGLIKELNNDKYQLSFSYALCGLLNQSYNSRIDFTTKYEYNLQGKLLNLKSSEFQIKYEYGRKDSIVKLYEQLSKTSVDFEYDKKNQEVGRNYFNGMKIKTTYGDNGFRNSCLGKNKQGSIIYGDFIFYDEQGRIKLVCNDKGEITKYTYDQNGKLVSTEYPYIEELRSFYYQEAIDCGMFIKSEYPDSDVLQLSENEIKALQKIINESEAKNRISPKISQKVWKETYEYNSTGCIVSIKNPFGKIFYEYDLMNRLVRKYASGVKNNGYEFKWNCNSQLVEIRNKKEILKMDYGVTGRPVSIKYENLFTGKVEFIEYSYDAMGRRMKEVINGSIQNEYVYDGLSTNILYKMPVTVNEVSVANYTAQISSSKINLVDALRLPGSSYEENPDTAQRTLLPENLDEAVSQRHTKPVSESANPELRINIVSDFDKWQLEDNRPQTVLLKEGCGLVNIYEDAELIGGYETECLLINCFDEVIGICDETSNIVAVTKYDVWGNVITGGKSGSYSNGRLISIGGIQFYDLGLRDYFPMMKSFSTMDPIRSGNNWFSYCPCDPVNNRDESGLYKKGAKASQNAKYTAALSDFIGFDGKTQKKTGTHMGIPLEYDCADTTATIDNKAANAAGLTDYSKMAKDFGIYYENGELSKARETTASKDYYTNDNSKVRQTSTSKKDLRNPDVVTPGTVIVTGPDAKKNVNTGHTIMVLARDIDSSGKIVGVVYIEGHMGDNKNAEVGYMYVNGKSDPSKNTWSIDAWRGTYEGTYEIESGEYGKTENKSCVK